MSDRHMRILRQMARQTQRQLEQHDTIDHAEDPASADQRECLNDAVKRTRGQVADAEQRRQVAKRRSDLPRLERATP